MNDDKIWRGKLSHPLTYKQLRQRARELRTEQTPAEFELWQHLSRRQHCSYKFRRQHIIDRFIVDFYCPEAALIVELDGKIHRYSGDRDAGRQEFLEGLGLTVLRFNNEEVFKRLDNILEQIDKTLLAVESR